ncbi:amidohydrolase family protein [Acuticoccus sp.]|uniref:amidohydrolase family protein n=1 Tax=Acuticoccus sp. TaxID=1904378 RepID=UPI003B517772
MGRLPVVDAHHHLWDPPRTRNPWLVERPAIPFRYGDYSRIARPFLPSDYREAARGQHVVASITMEGEWDPADPVAESAWMSGVAADTGMPDAHVARAFLDAADVEDVLEAHARYPLVRGVRQKPRANARPDDDAPGGMVDPDFRRGYAMLGPLGLAFDLQTPWWHLDEALELAEVAPDTLIVLNHAGLPADRSAEGLAAWRAALTRFATLPSARVKVSGLGTAQQSWPRKANRRIAREVVEMFGPDRTMVASNFPVDALCATFDEVMDTWRAAIADLAEEEQNQVLSRTAIATYRLEGEFARAPNRIEADPSTPLCAGPNAPTCDQGVTQRS